MKQLLKAQGLALPGGRQPRLVSVLIAMVLPWPLLNI